MSKPGTEEHTGGELVLPAFGLIEPERVMAQDELFAVVHDKFPVTPGHTLIIPKRSVKRFQELTQAERDRLLQWVSWAQDFLTNKHPPKDFNLGVNDGPAAGQTIPQFHFHVIPRRAGDVADPRGGLRWLFPGKAKYW